MIDNIHSIGFYEREGGMEGGCQMTSARVLEEVKDTQKSSLRRYR